MNDRMSAQYDPPTALAAAKKNLGAQLQSMQLGEAGSTVDRVLENVFRLLDVKAQLLLHRRLKRWLVAHVATASALIVLVLFHVATALTLIP